jgi:hypothetical protein
MKYNFNQNLVEEDLDQEFDKLKDAIIGIAGELHSQYAAFNDAVDDEVIDEDGDPIEQSNEEIAAEIYDDLTIELEDDEVDNLATQAAGEAGEAIAEGVEEVEEEAPDWSPLNEVKKKLKKYNDTLTGAAKESFKSVMDGITAELMPDFNKDELVKEELSEDPTHEEVTAEIDKVDSEIEELESAKKEVAEKQAEKEELEDDLEEESAVLTARQALKRDRMNLIKPLIEYVQKLKTTHLDETEKVLSELKNAFSKVDDTAFTPSEEAPIKSLIEGPNTKTAAAVLNNVGWLNNFSDKRAASKQSTFTKILNKLLGKKVEESAVTTVSMGSYIPDNVISGKPTRRVRPKIGIEEVKELVSKTILEEAVSRKKAGTLTANLCKTYNRILSKKGKDALATLLK